MIFDGDRSELGKYVREMADLMGLRDWTINLMHDPPPEGDGYAACVAVIYGRKIANIHFAKTWAQDDPEELRQTCVHELIHCHMEPTRWAVNNAREGLGFVGFSLLDGSFTDALECGIDAIATEWAKTLPLPVKADDEAEAA